MMELVCTLMFVGHLCLTNSNGGEVSTRVWEGFPTSGASITGEWWKADILWGSDYVQALNPTRVSRACAGDKCLSYFLHCGDAACKAVIGSGQNATLDFDIKASNTMQARDALKHFHYLIDPSDLSSAVWFGDFKEDRRFEDPHCNRRGRTPEGKILWDEGCEFLDRP
ncbi:MAG: hypothetical protein HY859_02925 [Caulobacterales bacterium]|nr:hypothetical protein [Caulobacterales bacterium]